MIDNLVCICAHDRGTKRTALTIGQGLSTRPYAAGQHSNAGDDVTSMHTPLSTHL